KPFLWRAGQLVARIGTVFQEPEHQFVTQSVADELAYGPRRAKGERDGQGGTGLDEQQIAERTAALLTRLRLDHLAEVNPYTLSGGEKRRLSVATVLAASPDVVILDEPTFGQDANTWREVAELLIEVIEQGTAVIAVTHDGHFARALGAR
ncbi:ABC transporter ATP-binding protein, partial [Glutamicibacter creatinolyticus]|uniref:ABC transporter ATP-binding protein n=1 Tax=Glutamicibacter creatinolyticus TaxID=162496 RepID=UPI003B982196